MPFLRSAGSICGLSKARLMNLAYIGGPRMEGLRTSANQYSVVYIVSTYEKALHGGGAKSLILWCRHHESNTGPTDYKSVALPTELYRLSSGLRMLRRAALFAFPAFSASVLVSFACVFPLSRTGAGCRPSERYFLFPVFFRDCLGARAWRQR